MLCNDFWSPNDYGRDFIMDIITIAGMETLEKENDDRLRVRWKLFSNQAVHWIFTTSISQQQQQNHHLQNVSNKFYINGITSWIFF